MTDKSIVTQLPLWSFSPDTQKLSVKPPDLHTLATFPQSLPRCVASSPTILRCLKLLSPLDWAHFPERNFQRHWGQLSIAYAALAAVELTRLNEAIPSDGTFYYESSLAIDSQGDIWIAGATQFPPSPLQAFDANGKWLKGYNPGWIGDSLTQFYEIIFDKQDNIYVSDQNNRRIVKFDNNGNWLGAWGGYGSKNGQFNKMEGIFVDRDDYIYVADSGNNNVQKFRQSSSRR